MLTSQFVSLQVLMPCMSVHAVCDCLPEDRRAHDVWWHGRAVCACRTLQHRSHRRRQEQANLWPGCRHPQVQVWCALGPLLPHGEPLPADAVTCDGSCTINGNAISTQPEVTSVGHSFMTWQGRMWVGRAQHSEFSATLSVPRQLKRVTCNLQRFTGLLVSTVWRRICPTHFMSGTGLSKAFSMRALRSSARIQFLLCSNKAVCLGPTPNRLCQRLPEQILQLSHPCTLCAELCNILTGSMRSASKQVDHLSLLRSSYKVWVALRQVAPSSRA